MNIVIMGVKITSMIAISDVFMSRANVNILKGKIRKKKVRSHISVINNNQGKSKYVEFKYFYLLNVHRRLEKKCIEKSFHEAKQKLV